MPKNSSGFTLLEVLVALAISSIILGTTLFFSNMMYRSTAFQAERTALVSLLKQARNNAMNSVEGQAYGVALFPAGFTGYVLFVGEYYAASSVASRTYVPLQYPLELAQPAPESIVFNNRSGTTPFTGEIILMDVSRPLASTSIFINHTGYVGW